jgi:hypothetical protein
MALDDIVPCELDDPDAPGRVQAIAHRVEDASVDLAGGSSGTSTSTWVIVAVVVAIVAVAAGGGYMWYRRRSAGGPTEGV